jgi:hypothetical protein
MAESFVDTFKTELVADRVWRSRSQLELAIVALGRLVQRRAVALKPRRRSARRVRGQRISAHLYRWISPPLFDLLKSQET